MNRNIHDWATEPYTFAPNSPANFRARVTGKIPLHSFLIILRKRRRNLNGQHVGLSWPGPRCQYLLSDSEANSASKIQLLSLASCMKNMPSRSNVFPLWEEQFIFWILLLRIQKSNAHGKHSTVLERQTDQDSRNYDNSSPPHPAAPERTRAVLSASKPPSDMGNSESSCIGGHFLYSSPRATSKTQLWRWAYTNLSSKMCHRLLLVLSFSIT